MARYNRNILNNPTLAPVNAELEKIEDAIEDTLSRKGDTPNQMDDNLDMNSQRIINLSDPKSDNDAVNKSYVDNIVVDGMVSSLPASSVTYDDTSSVSASANVQDSLDNLNEGTKVPYRLGNAIMSWWSNPVFLNAGRYSYLACSDNRGSLKLSITDNLHGNTEAYLMDVDNFNPDDHNTGAVASDGENVLAIWPGRRNTSDTGACYYQSFSAGDKPSLGLTKLQGGNNYPQVYDIDDEFIFFSRITQTASTPQWGVRISSWPFQGIWGAQTTLFQSTFSWPYIASRRSTSNKNRINVGLAWHPINTTSDNSLYYGYIERLGGDWLFRGVQNISSGTGLPLDESDFELVYTPTAPNTTRLLGIAENAMLFVEYDSTGDGSDGIYKYARKVSGSWIVNDIVASGVPFQIESATLYHGGGAIDSNDINTVKIAREASGIWYYETYVTADNGASWTRKEQYLGNEEAWQDIILARPMYEDYSYTAWDRDRSKLRSFCFAGRYSEIDYDNFDTDILDERYLATEYNSFPVEANRLQNRFVTTVNTSTTLKRRWREWTFLITNGSPVTWTIPSDSDEDIPIGSRFDFIGNGGTVTLQGDTGVSLNYVSGGSMTFTSRDKVTAIKVGGNSWFVFKDARVTVS